MDLNTSGGSVKSKIIKTESHNDEACRERIKCREKINLPGSYTIEASILISLILLIIMTWFYLAFSFHDRLVFRALALFYTEAAGRMMEEPVSEEGRLEIERLNERSGILIGTYVSRIKPSVLEERFYEAAQGLLLISRPETVKLNAQGRAVRFTYRSDTAYPLALPDFSFLYDDNEAHGEIRYSLSVPPETFIRAARGLIWRE